MKNRDKVLQILYKKNGECISSTEIAQDLDITRSAIFKIINELKNQGYNIESIHHKGYRLLECEDLISVDIINEILSKNKKHKKIKYLKTVDSTNTLAKKIIIENAEFPDVVIANTQTNGRGRLGRNFYSPENKGIYCSFILEPFIKIENSILVTVAASVAVSKAIEKITGRNTQIKWINDIYIDNKKVSGILTEAVTNFETGMIDKIVLGVGINFKMQENSFPGEISDIATAIYTDSTQGITRNKLIAQLILEIDECIGNIEDPNIIAYYTKKSIVIGKEINIHVLGEKESISGKAVNIDKNGFLIVETKNGLITLNSGEVSIRF
ncbi:MAG: biotin--[acetyl-CoA-carboxylase] ligase [Proteocatella sp.]